MTRRELMYMPTWLGSAAVPSEPGVNRGSPGMRSSGTNRPSEKLRAP